MVIQDSFNPVDFNFTWTDNGWYEWDSEAAKRAAKKARDTKVNELRKLGYIVKKSVLKNQLITRGGIGTGRPHVEFIVDVYNYSIV